MEDFYVINIRRKIHSNPEVGFDLEKTLLLIKNELKSFNIPYSEKYGKSSIVATINNNKKYTIGIRADIDALPIVEKTKCLYKSKIRGQMHACGHDAHCAILLDVARRLIEVKDKLNCNVKLIFQAAEEYKISGAKLMVEDNLLKDIDCMLALHVDPRFECGKIAVSSGPINALSNGFYLDFYGKSSHVAKQEDGVDAISLAIKAYSAIELMIAKEIPYNKVCIFNLGTIHGGNTNNIICDHVNMYGTIRTYDEDIASYVINRIKEIILYTAKSSKGKAKFSQGKSLPIVYNDETLVKKIKEISTKIVGNENVIEDIRTTWGEDFGYYCKHKPSVMFKLGIKNEDKNCVYELHQNKFNIDEDALSIGSDIFVNFVLNN